MELSREISELVARFVERVAALAREVAQAQLTSALGEAPPVTGKGRGRRDEAPSSPQGVTRARASRGRRSPDALERLREALRAHVLAHPGQRIEQINAALGTAPGELAVPLKKLIAAGQVRAEGTKRSTRYFPGRDASEPTTPTEPPGDPS